MPERIIVDTSALIALDKLNLLPILCKIYSPLIIPEGVIKEFGTISLPCVEIKRVESTLIGLLTRDLNLGNGEAEVISLAHHLGSNVIIDDLIARRIAEKIGLKVIGTIGVLLKAQKLGIIESAYNKVLELKNKGFYVSEDLLESLKNVTGTY